METLEFRVDNMLSDMEGSDYGSSTIVGTTGSRMYIKWRLADDRKSVEFQFASLNDENIGETKVDRDLPLWRAEVLRRHATDY